MPYSNKLLEQWVREYVKSRGVDPAGSDPTCHHLAAYVLWKVTEATARQRAKSAKRSLGEVNQDIGRDVWTVLQRLCPAAEQTGDAKPSAEWKAKIGPWVTSYTTYEVPVDCC